MAEEIQVEGARSARPDDGDFLQYLFGVEQGTRQRTQPPARQTATTIADPFDPAIGAWMIGASNPTASRN